MFYEVTILGQVDQPVVEKEEEMTEEQIQARIEALTAEIAAHNGNGASSPKTKKNHKVGKASATRKYSLLSGTMANWGKIPQQQADLAELLSKSMSVTSEYSEQEVFNFLIDGCGDYPSLYRSKQDVTYLFKYYRSLKNDGNHAGFVARKFVRMEG